jgi:hypothetical protein
LLLPAGLLTAGSITAQSNKSKIEQINDFSLKGQAKADFKKFRRKAVYFGSIYVNRPERIAGSFWNVNSTELADHYAQASCQAQSKNPDFCVLYARVKPKNYIEDEKTNTLSRESNIAFKEYLRLQNGDRFGAFAVSDNGAVGYSWAESTRAMAIDEALKKCAKSARKLMRDTPKLLRPVVAAPSRHGCRMVHLAD